MSTDDWPDATEMANKPVPETRTELSIIPELARGQIMDIALPLRPLPALHRKPRYVKRMDERFSNAAAAQGRPVKTSPFLYEVVKKKTNQNHAQSFYWLPTHPVSKVTFQ
jgi:hypothetical protein